MYIIMEIVSQRGFLCKKSNTDSICFNNNYLFVFICKIYILFIVVIEEVLTIWNRIIYNIHGIQINEKFFYLKV